MGVPKLIPSPDIMWQHFVNYREITKNSPFEVHDFVGKEAIEVYRKKQRCISFEGFCNYLDNEDVITTPEHYFMNYQGRYEEFVGVCARIKRLIRQDQIEGGMAGIYNPSITQRLNNLVERVDQTTGGEKLPSSPTFKLPDGTEVDI